MHSSTVAEDGANATVRHLPATLALALGSLGPGTHKLTTKLTYSETRRVHGRRRSVTVTKSLSARFSVC